MYFKSLTLQGFKSFAEKTTLEFTGGITAVVGPNGSGKSNISDAIRWVMGEMSAKTLRGSKMEDVIFGGTEKRKPLGFAEVTITLDNQERQFDIEYDEVSVTRRVYRSGESEYYINKAPCRLKDIHELFMDTGLGRDGYSIIGQGKIDAILSAKSDERRHIFDEAAGITKYRYRKTEAEKKLAATQENLLRANDIITELDSRLGTLKRQSETAKKYLELRGEQKNVEVNLWIHIIDSSKIKLEKTKTDYENLNVQIEDLERQITNTQTEINRLRDFLRLTDSKLDSSKAQMYQGRESITRIKGENDVIAANIQNNVQSIYRISGEIDSCRSRIDALSAASQPQNDAAQEIETRKNAVLADISDLTQQLLQVAQNIGKEWSFSVKTEKSASFTDASQLCDDCISRANKAYNKYINDAAAAKSDLKTLENRRLILLELENDFEGYSKSIKSVMNEHKFGRLKNVSIYGPVSSLIEVDNKYITAIEAAAGGALNNIVTETEQDAKAAISFLKSGNLGRVTFMPVSSVKASSIKTAGYEKCSGYIGVAADLVSCSGKFKNIVSQLLSRTVIVDSYDNAVDMARRFGYSFKIATLSGEIINPGGSITGGSVSKTGGGLSRRSEIAAVEEKLEAARKLISDGDSMPTVLQQKNEEFRRSCDEIRRKYWESITQQKSIEKDFEVLQNRADEAKNEVTQLEDSIAEKKRQIAALELENKENADKTAKNTEISAQLEQSAEELRQQIENLGAEREKSDKKSDEKQAQLQELNSQSVSLHGEAVRLETRISKLEEDNETIITKLWDEYELTYTVAQKFRRDIDDMGEEHKLLNMLKSKIKALGNINLDAIDEYAASSERYEFLTTQRDDILTAKQELETLIEEITVTMTELFEKNFAVLREKFKETFKELFGGGNADLSLSDPQEILESGVEITVQPPGKKLQNITLLSGGEKAFTAIALIFAILKINPTQFCVFDEIEAALDDVNVFRYADFLHHLSGNTQFIVITHRKGTMEAADTLYGVTMQEKGVTSLLSLDMTEI